ncbi:phytoene desaturase [Halarchaeum rubridurum]|uniref:Phytoene dehydrogenase n=1 Tax=Halarchaeum rubridurum TaxID=489911 RepID=A0A830FM55_9EURY|nr:phytoene desaturase [Halarchaeum rubridurum]GGM60653.1 phytoene dehydrogenase [Halarchaeum rubridurum]
MSRSVTVVGGGFGGLSAACYLADAGCDVTVVERNDQLGGRASVLERDGFRFDMGPSWYLMPDVFERFFGYFGREPEDYYGLTHLDPHYRVFFKDGEGARDPPSEAGSGTDADAATDGAGAMAGGRARAMAGNANAERVDVDGDIERTKALFESYEDGAGEAFERYLAKSEETYEVGMEHFVYTDRPNFRDYVDWDVVRNARGLGLLGTMQEHVADYFEHPRLQQLVQYTLVFLGGSPSNTPALYNLMSHVDFNLGVHYPEGGLASVVDALASLGDDLGVTYRTGTPVAAIRGERGDMRAELANGEILRSDAVVSDADYAHTEQELLDPDDRQYDADYWESRTYAPSAYLLYLGVEGDLDPLAHHTLVLPDAWDEHFDAIFDDPAWPDDPAYYLCAPSETDDAVAPDGHSALFALVPIAPGLDDGEAVRADYRDLLLDDVAEHTGLDLRERIVVEEDFCVSDFAERYNATEGSALGLAHTLRQTGPLRPDHRSSALDGLYFTGGFTRPGIGVPMCLISGEHAARAVCDDLA